MIKKYMKWMAGIGAALSLTGCGLFASDSAFAPANLTTFTATTRADILWRTDIGSGVGYGFSPAVVGNSVYAATRNGEVVRLDLNTGKVLWRVDIGQSISSGVASNGQVVVVATENGHLVALDAANGKQKWEATPSTLVSIPAMIVGDQVVVRANDFRVQAFDVNTGALRWSYLRASPMITLRANAELATIGNNVVAGQPIGHLVALNQNTGRLTWDATISQPQGGTSLGAVTDIAGKPLVLGQTICVSSYQGNMACTDVQGNQAKTRWSIPFSSAVGLGYANGQLYTASLHGELRAVDFGTGATVWSNKVLANRELTNPVPNGKYLVTGDYAGYLHFFDRQNGQLVGRYFTGSHDAIRATLLETPLGVLVELPDGDLMLMKVVSSMPTNMPILKKPLTPQPQKPVKPAPKK